MNKVEYERMVEQLKKEKEEKQEDIRHKREFLLEEREAIEEELKYLAEAESQLLSDTIDQLENLKKNLEE